MLGSRYHQCESRYLREERFAGPLLIGHQSEVLRPRDRSKHVTARDDEQLALFVPIASRHRSLEHQVGPNGQFNLIAHVWQAGYVDAFQKSDVGIVDGPSVRTLERVLDHRNLEIDFNVHVVKRTDSSSTGSPRWQPTWTSTKRATSVSMISVRHLPAYRTTQKPHCSTVRGRTLGALWIVVPRCKSRRLLARHTCRLLVAVVVVVLETIIGEAQRTSDPRVADLVRAGNLRLALFLPQYTNDPTTGEIRGDADLVEIARGLAQRLGVALSLVGNPTPLKAMECLNSGACDIAFLGTESSRIREVRFSPGAPVHK